MSLKVFAASAVVSALALAAPAAAAVFNASGNLAYERPELVLTGVVDADLEGLDLRARQRYVASAKLVLPKGFTVVPVLENNSGIGPATIMPFVEVDGPLTVFDVSTVTPPFRVSALLNFDLGPFTIGQALRGAFNFLDANPSDLETIMGVGVGWDVRGVVVTPQTLNGPFAFGAFGDPVAEALDDLAFASSDFLLVPLLRQLDRQGDLPPVCANNPQACANALSIDGVDAFSVDYELHLALRPLGVIPVPAALPLAATGVAALLLLRRRPARS